MKGYRYCSVIMVVLAGLLTAMPAFAQGERGQNEGAQNEDSRTKQDTPVKEPTKELAKDQDENIPPDRITIHQLKRMMDAKEEVVIVDNRAGSAYIGSTVKIKGAIHITIDDLEKKMKDLPKHKLIITYCT
jgi:hypothetical protein